MISIIKSILNKGLFTKKDENTSYIINDKKEVKELFEKNFKHKLFVTKENSHSIIAFYIMYAKQQSSMNNKNMQEIFVELLNSLNKHIRKSDKIVRTDERDFIILLPDTVLIQAENVLKRTQKIIMDFSLKHDITLHPTYRLFRFTPLTDENRLMDRLFMR